MLLQDWEGETIVVFVAVVERYRDMAADARSRRHAREQVLEAHDAEPALQVSEVRVEAIRMHRELLRIVDRLGDPMIKQDGRLIANEGPNPTVS
jgi:hypothetical protein